MKLCILLINAIFLATISECRHVMIMNEENPIQEQENTRQKRSDDTAPLQTAFNQLASRVTALEAKITADEAKMAAQGTLSNTLNSKRCETGRRDLNPHGQSEVTTGDHHERRHTVHVTFAHPFPSTPWVAVSLAELDVDSDANFRVNSGSSAVSASGFDAYVYEWADTHITSVAITWIACSV